jgi:hypothetical protein
VTIRSRVELVQDVGDYDGDQSYEDYSVSLVVPLKELLFLGVIKLGFIVLHLTDTLKWLWYTKKMWYCICIMSEKPNTQIFDQDAPIDTNFSQVEEWQKKDAERQAADAARRVLETDAILSAEEADEAKKQQQKNRLRGLAAAAATLTTIGGVAGVGLYNDYKMDQLYNNAPKTSVTIEPNGSVSSETADILGINKVDAREIEQRISVDPANIDVLKDGLQPGEKLVVPEYLGEKPPTNE